MKPINLFASIPLIVSLTLSDSADAQITTSEITVEETGDITSIQGKVGIGTDSPATSLHVDSDGDTYLTLNSSLYSSGVLLRKNNANIWAIASERSSPILGANSNDLVFYNYNTGNANMIIESASGNIDIGTLRLSSARVKSTSSNLHLDAGTGFTYLNYYDGEGVYFGDGSMSNHGAWLKNGQVGIGTFAPIRKLHVEQLNGSIQVQVGRTGGNPGIADFGADGNGLHFWVGGYDGLGNEEFFIGSNRNVGVGTMNPLEKLHVNGKIRATGQVGWADFVFNEDYYLPNLSEVEEHIKTKGHLKDIPSEKEVIRDGYNLGDMDARLLQKIEELTLYVIEQNKKLKDQEDRIAEFERKLDGEK